MNYGSNRTSSDELINKNKLTNRKEQGIAGFSVLTLREMLINKKISIPELVEAYLFRIQKYDTGKDGLNSVAQINEDARRIAVQMQEDLKYDRDKPLYGIPILLKDNIETDGNLHSTAGALSLAELKTKQDAKIVKYLKENGAIILGKTNLTELANYTTKNMPGGYSARGGQVKSAFGKEVDPYGSSTGSAVAVSAGFCAASIGTDTSNSIIAPSLQADIVGFRPPFGKVSLEGIIPISFTLDTVGPMVRTIEDAALIYDCLRSGYDSDSKNPGIFQRVMKEPINDSLKDMHFAVNMLGNEKLSENDKRQSDALIGALREAGATITEITIPITESNRTIMRYEFKYAMNRYLASLPSSFPIKCLKDIIEFNHVHAKQALKYGQIYLEDAEMNTSGCLDEEKYRQALKEREDLRKRLNIEWKQYNAILFRSNTTPHYVGYPVVALPFTKEHYKAPEIPINKPYGLCLTAFDDFTALYIGRRIARVLKY